MQHKTSLLIPTPSYATERFESSSDARYVRALALPLRNLPRASHSWDRMLLKRRTFITLLGAWPLAARAQQASKSWRIGFLTPRSLPLPLGHDAFSDAFVQGMNELGYSEGKNL